MNARAFLIIPAVLTLGVLAGCGQTDGATGGGTGGGDGSTRIQSPLTEVCQAPAWIRKRIPDGLCTTPVVEDDLSPLTGE